MHWTAFFSSSRFLVWLTHKHTPHPHTKLSICHYTPNLCSVKMERLPLKVLGLCFSTPLSSSIHLLCFQWVAGGHLPSCHRHYFRWQSPNTSHGSNIWELTVGCCCCGSLFACSSPVPFNECKNVPWCKPIVNMAVNGDKRWDSGMCVIIYTHTCSVCLFVCVHVLACTNVRVPAKIRASEKRITFVSCNQPLSVYRCYTLITGWNLPAAHSIPACSRRDLQCIVVQ